MHDIHSHILFGVDDGSRSLAESQAMLRAAREVGLRRLVCTPHFHNSGRRFDRALIERNFAELAVYAKQQELELLLGFEVHWKALLETGVEHAPEFCIADSDLLLLEFSYNALPPHWQRLVFELQAMELQVIVAHPERYVPLQRDIAIAQEMSRMGCLLQLSADFAGRGALSASKKTAIALIKHGLVDYIASDAHCVADYQNYPKAIELWEKKRPR
jgi:protein-tyrosine phosphatase